MSQDNQEHYDTQHAATRKKTNPVDSEDADAKSESSGSETSGVGETEQQLNEKLYNDYAPEFPDIISAKKMRKLQFTRQFAEARVLFVNFQYDHSYDHVLTKLMSLYQQVPATVQAVIVGLGPNATFVDTTVAE